MKERIIIILLFLLIIISACSKNNANYIPGTYVGEAQGYYSILKVQVVVDEKHIISIDILEQEEAPIIADAVFSEIPPKVIKENSTDVDTVSGATYTSKTLLKAIDNALSEAIVKQDE